METVSRDRFDRIFLSYYRKRLERADDENRHLWDWLIDLISSVSELDDYDGVQPVKQRALTYGQLMIELLEKRK